MTTQGMRPLGIVLGPFFAWSIVMDVRPFELIVATGSNLAGWLVVDAQALDDQSDPLT